jgi:tetratricopeptide (TPR) repeat protein
MRSPKSTFGDVPAQRRVPYLAVGIVALAAIATALISPQSRHQLWFFSAAAVVAGGALAISVDELRRRSLSPMIDWWRNRRRYLVPKVLPPAPRPFVGRDEYITRIVGLIDAVQPPTPLIVLYGAAGIGKTSLALHIAHLVSESFPDGQLYARFDAGAQDVDAPSADVVYDTLGRFIAALQSPAHRTPPSPRRRRRRYARLTRKRRILIVLDGLDDLAAMRDLLPSGSDCAVIVTSRDRPSWSPAGAVAVKLGELAEPEALALLREIAGGRVDDEGGEADEIVRATEQHPLSIRVAGAALAARPQTSLRSAIGQLRSATSRPGGHAAFTADGPTADADAFAQALDFSYALLTDEEQRALLMLGLLNRRQFAVWMLAAVMDGDDERAFQIADRLVSTGLVDRSSTDSAGVPVFTVHEHVLRYASARRQRTATPDDDRRRLLTLVNRRGERESSNASDLRLDEDVYRALDAGRLFNALSAARDAVGLARDAKDSRVRGLAVAAFADVQTELGNSDAAVDLANAVLEDPSSAPLSRARAHRCLGALYRRHRQFNRAERSLHDALLDAEAAADIRERIKILAECAVNDSAAGKRSSAKERLRSARSLLKSINGANDQVEIRLLWAGSTIFRAAGEYSPAASYIEHANDLSTHGELGLWRAWMMHERALLDLEQNRSGDARRSALDALELFAAMNHRYGKAHCRLVVGASYAAEARFAEATPVLEEALDNFTGCGDRWDDALASRKLAGAYAHRGHHAAARPLLEAAITTFSDFGDEDSLRDALAELSAFPADRASATTGPSATGPSATGPSATGPSATGTAEGLAHVLGQAER